VKKISEKKSKKKDKEMKEVKAKILTGFVAKETANLALKGKAADAKKKNAGWMGFMDKVAKNAPMSVENQKYYDDFQVENEELNDLVAQTEAQSSMSIAKQDEVASKLYSKKQMKKK